MFVRKTLAALASLAVAGAGMLALASPSHAAEQIEIICRTAPPTDTFSGTGPWTFENTSANGGYCQNFRVVSLSGGLTQGDVSLLTDNNGNDVYDTDASAAFSGWTSTQEGVEVSTTAASGGIILEFRPTGTAGTSGEVYTITIGGGGGGDTPSGNGGSTDAISGPAPHIQQFAMPETGTCDEAQPEGLNWGGVASGGWSDSWAQWMNDGEGGEVCTRTLIYNTSKAAWEVD